MTTAGSLSSELRDLYTTESARIREDFADTGNGWEAISQRTALVEKIALHLWKEIICPGEQGPQKFALVALGGFGRSWLFPHSDVDLLFLHADHETEEAFKDQVRGFSQGLWDLRLKVSPATRVLQECDRFDPANVEFAISLLDCRYLAGDRDLFTRLHDKVIPKLMIRETQPLVQRLADVTRKRYEKFGNTIFHLEPDVKDTPGGLRDCNVALWLSLLSSMEKLHDWPDPKSLLSSSTRKQFEPALDFLMSVRCFLHLRYGRDDNMLSWEAQEEAAKRGIGVYDAHELAPADWMRIYFGHARSIHRTATQLLEEIPAAWSSLSRHFHNLRARVSDADFSVVDGLVFLRQASALQYPEILLRLFHFVAHHDVRLSTTTEYKIEQVLPSLAATPPRGAELWLYLGEILTQPHAAHALRAMHSLRLLTLLLPELKAIDSLVVRDFYHRFTVDEHSFLAIESLHRLRQSHSEWEKQYAEILDELEQPELLYLSLLLHDTGKGAQSENHVVGSLLIAEQCLERLDLEASERDTVLFMIGNHLEMSATLRRDIFDSPTVAAFADKVGTPERLKMLCLFTYADIKAVNPDALTPWKAENVWQLYIAAANQLNRNVDQRLHPDAEVNNEKIAQLRTLAPTAGKKVKAFLEGLPQRYLRTYAANEVLHHLEMSGSLGKHPIHLDLKRGRHWFEVTLVTTDRPFLFGKVAGALAAWGMNIVKATAFSNQAGTVVDTFYFTDRFRTLELNLSEWERFKRGVSDVLTGEADLDRMLKSRMQADEKKNTPKVKIKTSIEFDEKCSSNSTLVQVVTQDRPGLLYTVASCFSHHKCNIEIALIDTEGQMAIDVFYLTAHRKKLTGDHLKEVETALGEALRSGHSQGPPSTLKPVNR
jgi:[protein-PII] uridylyltransferase